MSKYHQNKRNTKETETTKMSKYHQTKEIQRRPKQRKCQNITKTRQNIKVSILVTSTTHQSNEQNVKVQPNWAEVRRNVFLWTL